MIEGLAGADALRGLFEHSRPPSFGAEEEVMILDAGSLDLLPDAARLLQGLSDRRGLKLELPASQLEIVAPACASVEELVRELQDGRRRLVHGLPSAARVAAAGAHPFAAPEGELNRGDRYEGIEREYGPAVRRQLVCGLHVHVGIHGPDRVLAVYNALRSHLPDLAALGANAPMHAGRDSGMASVRPGIAGLLPRQGVPPAFASWEDLAAAFAWGASAGRLRNAREWWWELRIHPVLGTIEVRVPDAQTVLADAAAIVATVAALVLWLAARHDAGELLPVAETWRIAENRWSAARYGIHGEMVDLQTGERLATRERLHRLLVELEPFAAAAGGSEHLPQADRLADLNGADRQRAIAAERGLVGLTDSLAHSFLDPLPFGSVEADPSSLGETSSRREYMRQLVPGRDLTHGNVGHIGRRDAKA